jgi:uncharacterized protein (TIGR03437 family)
MAAGFGRAIPISGEASDLALDEARGLLYVANFTAARIDVVSLAAGAVQTSMHVAPGPSSLALSQDGHYLLATHFGNAQSPGSPSNALTVIDLTTGARQTFSLDGPPLGAAFGADGLALVATTTDFVLFDPAIGTTQPVGTVAGVSASTLPAAPGTPPVQIVAAAMGVSSDGRWIVGVTDSLRFVYDVAGRQIRSNGYTASPPLGPRVVSVARDGSTYAAGWGVFDRTGTVLAQFGGASGTLAQGSLALDSATGTLYAQIPAVQADPSAPPVLFLADSDNLTIRERLVLPENLAGRSLLNSAGDTLYAVSESGVMVLPVGLLNSATRLSVDHEDLLFQGNFCQHGAISQTLAVSDPGGGHTSFSISTDLTGVTISPAAGRTPATVRVTIDPAAFANQRGTVSGTLKFTSSDAVNVAPSVRLLVNNRRPDERGAATNVPGTLSDILADPGRDRFYLLRQDRNQLLVYDGSSLTQIAALRTGATPTRMAVTFDQKYLLVGHENSQQLYVYDLDALQFSGTVPLPRGHYPRSVAASGNAILVAARVAGTTNTIDRIDLLARTATTLPSLGMFQNSVNADTALVASPNGGTILAASADGNVLLYDAAADSFIISRKLPAALSGAFAASGDGQYLAGSTLLNSSLVPATTWNDGSFPSGFAFAGGQGIRLTGPQNANGNSGVLSRIDLAAGLPVRPTRVSEQPLVGGGYSVFTRTLAPLANGQTIIALTISGFTALAWNFDAAVVPPVISRIVNAADLTSRVTPGSPISVFGSNLGPLNQATQQIPLPTAIAESCLTANGVAVPMMFVSPGQINAQLPLHLDGRTTMTLYTPGGVSDDYYVNVQAIAPAIFLSGAAGPITGIPVVVKNSNQELVTPTNPIHAGDDISIYAAGLGPTSPEVPAGFPSPGTPLASNLQLPDVTLGGIPLAVSFAGLAPGEIGVYQINARAPNKPVTGMEVPLTITQGGLTATINVRVID